MDRPYIRGGCLHELVCSLMLLLVIGCLPPVPSPPGPAPNPVVPVNTYRVLIVEERSERENLPSTQIAIFTSSPLRKWLTDNKAEFRNEDKDVDVSRLSADWQKLVALPRQSLPWIVVTGKGQFSGPLPKTVEETQALIARYKP